MSGSDLIAAVRPVLETLDRLRVRHFIGGSVASSAHGIARASLDVDVVAELEPIHVSRLVAALEPDYFVDEARVRAAVEAKRSFNLIHLETMFKVDVFVSRGRPFDDSSFSARAENDWVWSRANQESPSRQPRMWCSPSSSGIGAGERPPNVSGAT